MLVEFIALRRFPLGPLLLTDWGRRGAGCSASARRSTSSSSSGACSPSTRSSDWCSSATAARPTRRSTRRSPASTRTGSVRSTSAAPRTSIPRRGRRGRCARRRRHGGRRADARRGRQRRRSRRTPPGWACSTPRPSPRSGPGPDGAVGWRDPLAGTPRRFRRAGSVARGRRERPPAPAPGRTPASSPERSRRRSAAGRCRPAAPAARTVAVRVGEPTRQPRVVRAGVGPGRSASTPYAPVAVRGVVLGGLDGGRQRACGRAASADRAGRRRSRRDQRGRVRDRHAAEHERRAAAAPWPRRTGSRRRGLHSQVRSGRRRPARRRAGGRAPRSTCRAARAHRPGAAARRRRSPGAVRDDGHELAARR